ncbi:MAG: choline-sulfatase [Rhizobiaceae bacterium]|nr:choline-sulfatase [Rhizobiaceae bacterium]
MKNPNILFIQVDQMLATSLAAYGNSFAHTPHLDQIADRGVVFETAYCNFPLCAPSRFSMAAGQLCSAIGAFDNAAEMPASIPTYAHYLRSFGYQTALSGKMHFIGPDQHHGFETRLTADLYPADFSWVPNWADEGDRDTNDPRSVLISGLCARSVQIDFDEEVTFKAVRHIYDMARSADDRPFFLQVSYTHPHEPYLCRQEYWDLYEHADIPLPSVPPMRENQHDAHSVRLLKDFGMLDFGFEEADVRRARRAYYGSISYLDELIGNILAALKSTGMDRNTAIIFTSDHGEMLGERGMWFKKHFFEPSLRIPLLMYAPWIKPQRVSEFASLVDLLPTFNGLAQGSVWEAEVEPLEGDDLTALLDRGNPEPSRAIHAEYLAEATLAPIFMIRRGRYKFVSSSKDPALLFDVETDPDELTNLAGEQSLAGVVKSFQAEVESKWDEEEITVRILQSQQRRRLILNAQKNGLPPRWNHGEEPGDQVVWYRGDGGYNEWAFDHLKPVGEDG